MKLILEKKNKKILDFCSNNYILENPCGSKAHFHIKYGQPFFYSKIDETSCKSKEKKEGFSKKLFKKIVTTLNLSICFKKLFFTIEEQ
ncbi:hypothetical protein BpHYR1_013622 [Brachionus plicatilis]|uniref:Uncharacterized protein n=1 Tax=Brachionus plicatilis TaxID=10195 RepID=A0A3M7S3G4_BRAPC|nr:hypothetical protein BpHYR1_013622 [Brachionus plicatilis]